MTLWRVVLASLFIGALVATRAAEPDFEFSGVLTAGEKTRLALTDKRSDTTEWVETGAEYNGFQIGQYDPSEDTLVVQKLGQEYRLRLIAQKTGPALNSRTATANAPSTEAAANAIRTNLRTLSAAARQYQLERGATAVSYAELVGPGKFISELKPVAGESYSSLTFTPNTYAVSVKMADGTLVSADLPPAPPAAVAASQSAPNPSAAPALPATAAPVAPPGSTPAGGAEPALTPTGRSSPNASGSYLVQSGDTWDRVSASTGVSIDELRRLNPAVTGSSLPAGQAIRIR